MKADNVEYQYGAKKVFQDLNLSVRKNAVTSIIGPNGSGKSTLLGLLSGYLQSGNGCVYLEGRDLKDYSKKRLAQKLAAVHQKSAVPEDFTVQSIIRYGRYSHQSMLKKDQHGEEVVQCVMEQLNLTQYANCLIHELSGGEMQRVFIAMALAQEAQYLLLDEPTTFLDLYYQFQILEIVKMLNQTKQLTIVMVLHDINQALAYSDEVICMKEGKIVAQGEPEKVITADLLKTVYHIDAKIIYDTDCGMQIGICNGGCLE